LTVLKKRGDPVISIQQIKNEVSIVDALERYTDIKVKNANRRSISVCCPFHGDNKPSAVIYPNTNTFMCFSGCTEGHAVDVISVVRLAHNSTLNEATQTITADFDLKADNTGQYQQLKKQKEANRVISEKMKEHFNKQFGFLHVYLRAINEKIACCFKTKDDLEKHGNLYHLKVQLEYWLEGLSHDDLDVKVPASKEITKFMEAERERVNVSNG
jgi:methylglyoxal synthase